MGEKTLISKETLTTLSPNEAAQFFGSVAQENYLAHSIREIELFYVRSYGESLNIFVRKGEIKDKSICILRPRVCEIFLPFDTVDIKSGEVRIRLAHELGHIVKSLHRIKDPSFVKEANRGIYSPEDEVYSWIFAFELISMKSNSYRANDYKKFIYERETLAAIIHGLVGKVDKTIAEQVMKSIPF